MKRKSCVHLCGLLLLSQMAGCGEPARRNDQVDGARANDPDAPPMDGPPAPDPVPAVIDALQSSVEASRDTLVAPPDAAGPSIDAIQSELCDTATAPCQGTVDFGGCKLFYFRSRDIDGFNPRIERAIIAVHGVGRDWNVHFLNMMRVVREANRLNSIVVLSPVFRDEGGAKTPDELAGGSYQGGREATCQAKPDLRVGAFAATDALIEKLANKQRFPDLKDIVVMGHSGGGQFAGRYGLVTRVVQKHPNLRFKFVPSNPSSWAFLDGRRNVEGRNWVSSGSEFDACRGYNTYQYGLGGIEGRSYLDKITVAEIVEHVRSRNFVFLMGGNDTCVPTPAVPCPYTDGGCAAMLQGKNRLTRGRNFHQQIQMFYPPYPGAKHELSIVPGVGHSSGGMYLSAEGRRAALE
jgi:hypothetical protein